MSLHTVSTGGTINAVDVNQMVNVLQQPSGGSESGKWFIESGGYQNGWTCAIYMPTLSRGSVPVSVSIDTADQSPTQSAGSPSTQNLTASGFQIIYSVSTLTNTSRCGGNWTVNY